MLTGNPDHIFEITYRLEDTIAQLPSPQIIDEQLFVKLLTDVLDGCPFDVDLKVYRALVNYGASSIDGEISPTENFCDL
jgi:hypothetical protein